MAHNFVPYPGDPSIDIIYPDHDLDEVALWINNTFKAIIDKINGVGESSHSFVAYEGDETVKIITPEDDLDVVALWMNNTIKSLYDKISSISTSLESDTSPKLGGNLNVNGFSIISNDGDNINISPGGTLIIKNTFNQSNLSEWRTSSESIGAKVNARTQFSNTGSFIQSECFGGGPYTVAGNFSCAFGYDAYAAGAYSVSVGWGSESAGVASISVGFRAGYQSSPTGCILLGAETGMQQGSITNTFMAGSDTYPINDVFFGKGKVSVSPTAYTIHGTGGSGTNIAGGNLVVAPGPSTGNAAPSSVIIQSTISGTTGSVPQTLNNTLTISNGTASFLGYITNSGGSTKCERFGAGTSRTTDYSTIIGASNNPGIGPRVVSIGSDIEQGSYYWQDGVNIGCGSAPRSYAVVIGRGATGSNNSIILGAFASGTDVNQFVAGSSNYPVNDIYFGKGVINTTPTTYTIHGTGGSGTNIVGGNLVLAPGQSTGNATPASVIIKATTAGSSGSDIQSLSDTLTITKNKITFNNSAAGVYTSLGSLVSQIDNGSNNVSVYVGAASGGGSRCVVIGHGAYSGGGLSNDNTVIGWGATSNDGSGIAIGRGALASTYYGIAIGSNDGSNNRTTAGGGGVAIGVAATCGVGEMKLQWGVLPFWGPGGYIKGDSSGKFGVNCTPLAAIHTISTTEQLRLGYDANLYASFTTDSNGYLRIGSTGREIRTPTPDGQHPTFAAIDDQNQCGLRIEAGKVSFVAGSANYAGYSIIGWDTHFYFNCPIRTNSPIYLGSNNESLIEFDGTHLIIQNTKVGGYVEIQSNFGGLSTLKTTQLFVGSNINYGGIYGTGNSLQFTHNSISVNLADNVGPTWMPGNDNVLYLGWNIRRWKEAFIAGTTWTGSCGGYNASGTDVVASDLIIKPGRSTGNATPASVIIQSTVAGTSGSSLQATKDTLKITNGYIYLAYDTNNYFSATVGSTGGITFGATGSGALFSFSHTIYAPNVIVNGNNSNVGVFGHIGIAGTSVLFKRYDHWFNEYMLQLTRAQGISAENCGFHFKMYNPYITPATTGGHLDIGNGVFEGNDYYSTVSATPYSGRISSTSGKGTNIAGASLYLTAGRGTGSANGGSFIFQTTIAGSSGSSLNSFSDRVTISPDIVTIRYGLDEGWNNYQIIDFVGSSAGSRRLRLKFNGGTDVFKLYWPDVVGCGSLQLGYYTASLVGHAGSLVVGSTTAGVIAYNGSNYSQPIFRCYSHTGSTKLSLTNVGDLSVGHDSPSARIHAISTTEQLRIGYDVNNYVSFIVSKTGNLTITPVSGVMNVTGNVMPTTDDTYYLGKNDDDSPLSWKGVILKDTTNGKYYRIEVVNGVLTATDLTD